MSLTLAVGGTRVAVESLAAPGQDPHTIEIKPGQLVRARHATLLIRVGLDHEPWLGRLRLPESVAIVDASQRARIIQTQTPRLRAERRAHAHAFGNTHYWLDPENAVPITAVIRDALATARPDDARQFERNRNAFLAVLTARIERWKAALAPFSGARLVVVHDSWSYFAERFGLQVVGAAEPQPGVPPAPAELALLFQRMREAGVKVVIADSHSNPSLVREIELKSGARAVTLFASGNDYLSLFDENVAKLAEALKLARP